MTVWRAILMVIFVVCIIATIGYLAGCRHQGQDRPGCTEADLALIVAECKAAQIRAKCEDAPKEKCPELVRICKARVDVWNSAECD